jgi:hypothetical protein
MPTIPTNYGFSHIGPNSSRGPSLKSAMFAIIVDMGALNTRQKAIQAKLDTFIAAYNAHRVLTAGSVHGAADSTNTETALTTTGEVTLTMVAGSTDT